MRASVRTQTGALLGHQRAVIELQGSHQVVVVTSDDKAITRPVTVGDKVGNLGSSPRGKPGERVVVEGLQKARRRDGQWSQPLPKEAGVSNSSSIVRSSPS